MSAQATLRGFAAALRYLYDEWRPGKWFENSDEKFILEALDRTQRKKLIASLSDRRWGRIWLGVLFLFPLLIPIWIDVGKVDDFFLLFPVIYWYEAATLDGRIKLLKLIDRMSHSLPPAATPTVLPRA